MPTNLVPNTTSHTLNRMRERLALMACTCQARTPHPLCHKRTCPVSTMKPPLPTGKYRVSWPGIGSTRCDTPIEIQQVLNSMRAHGIHTPASISLEVE